MNISGSGSATNSGIEYQQRVAAWFLVNLLLESDVSSQLELEDINIIIEIAFEISEYIDDLKLSFRDDFEAFLQIKRNVSLSTSTSSDFVKTIKQFVSQYLQNPCEKHFYILVTSSTSSSKVTRELRKILESIRLNDENFSNNPLNRSEKKTFQKYQQVVKQQYSEVSGSEMKDVDFVNFSKKVYVSLLDVETGSALEKVAILLLNRETIVNPELIWGLLIKNSLHYASKRLSLNHQGLKSSLKRYLKNNNQEIRTKENLVDEEFFRFGMEFTGNFSAGKEIILAVSPFEDFDYVVVEIFRFNNECEKKLKFFDNNKCEIAKDELWTVLHRCSTSSGISRFIEKNIQNLDGEKLLIIPANSSEDADATLCAEMHHNLINNLLKNCEDLLTCIHCAKPISELDSLLVELDDEEFENIAGLVHKECLRPIDRVLGVIQSEFFEKYDFLKRFDVETWARLILNGQGFFRNIKSAQISKGQVLNMVWSSDYEYNVVYNYCIRIDLKDGSSQYVTERGRVHLMNEDKANSAVEMFNRLFEEGRKEKDPLCYTSNHYAFGKYSLLLKIKDEDEKFIECVSAEKVRYNKLIGKIYNLNIDYYAPICVLAEPETEELLTINDHVVMISNPLKLGELIENWKWCGLEMPNYEIKIIQHDYDFDNKARSIFDSGPGIVIDPIIDRDGDLIHGLLLVNMQDVIRHKR
jgi:hypothetical protein